MTLPAHHTKHLPILETRFQSSAFSLSQRADGISNGTALWLGAQVLSSYLADALPAPKPSADAHRPCILELGSGIGFSALALATLGYDVQATDTSHVIASVLEPNITANAKRLSPNAGRISVRELDWTVPPEHWNWDHASTIASPAALTPSSAPADPTNIATFNLQERSYPHPPFAAIISADTLYEPALVTPLLRTLHAAASLSPSASSSSRSTPVFLCVERRDPAVIDAALEEAVNVWRFSLERVPKRKLSKALDRAGFTGWKAEDWDGMEVYKLVLKGGSLTRQPTISTG
ncbi:unnamed protein product [Peniophora sp. CBMAI 1063]|nr:unnamed protein product [Peniophora sp. CBMAI 1063]